MSDDIHQYYDDVTENDELVPGNVFNKKVYSKKFHTNDFRKYKSKEY